MKGVDLLFLLKCNLCYLEPLILFFCEKFVMEKILNPVNFIYLLASGIFIAYFVIIKFRWGKWHIIKQRSVRWTFVNLIVASSPISVSIIISIFLPFLSPDEIIRNSIDKGAFIVVALSIAATQYITVYYARDFEGMDHYSMSKIGVGFLIITTASIIGFTSLQIASWLEENSSDVIMGRENSLYNWTSTIFSLLLIIGSMIYAARVHRGILYFQWKKGHLKFPSEKGNLDIESELKNWDPNIDQLPGEGNENET